MTDLITIILLSEIGAFLPIFVWIIINHFGGYPLAIWRLRGIARFGMIIFGPDKRPTSRYLKQEIVVNEDPAGPMFDYGGKKWAYGGVVTTEKGKFETIGKDDGSQAITSIGDPLFYYNHDDINPIKWRDFNAPGKVDGKLIMEAWKNDAIERMHNVGRKPPIPWFLILAVGIIVMAMVAVNIYYAHDTLCAIKPRVC